MVTPSAFDVTTDNTVQKPNLPSSSAASSSTDGAAPEIVVERGSDEPKSQLLYSILQRPPWATTVCLGLQQYLTMLGSTVLIPFIIVPAFGGTEDDKARVISTIFFISGVVTLLQTVLGDRLPIIQGGSFAFIAPALSLAASIKNDPQYNWAATDAPDGSNHTRFLLTMRTVSGGIIGSSLIIFFIGASGLLKVCLRYISPLTVSANIAVVALSLYSAGFNGVGACVQLGIPMIFFLILFSQFMKNIAIPIPKVGKLRIFELFPVVLAIAVTWIYGVIVTEAGAYDNASAATQAACRTDQTMVLHHSPWIRFPYPGQWGRPILTTASVFTMLAGGLSAMVESLGDYYAAAAISGAPVPPPDVLARGVTWQGISCILTGCWQTGNATTAYNENIGAMQITRVGSKIVIQAGAVIAIIFGIIGKIGGLFASMPNAMVSGLFCVCFALIVGVGISQFRHCDQESPRNLLTLGFAIYMGLSVPYYFTTYTSTYKHGPVNTGSQSFNNIANSIFETGAAVALIITMVLDNAIPGTIKERGLHVWSRFMSANSKWWEDEEVYKVYGLPFGMTLKYEKVIGPLREKAAAPFRKMLFWRKNQPASTV